MPASAASSPRGQQREGVTALICHRDLLFRLLHYQLSLRRRRPPTTCVKKYAAAAARIILQLLSFPGIWISAAVAAAILFFVAAQGETNFIPSSPGSLSVSQCSVCEWNTYLECFYGWATEAFLKWWCVLSRVCFSSTCWLLLLLAICRRNRQRKWIFRASSFFVCCWLFLFPCCISSSSPSCCCFSFLFSWQISPIAAKETASDYPLDGDREGRRKLLLRRGAAVSQALWLLRKSSLILYRIFRRINEPLLRISGTYGDDSRVVSSGPLFNLTWLTFRVAWRVVFE